MENARWKGIAELIGIAAIVASLIFVGMEMRQAQDIARAENAISNSSDRIALQLAIANDSEIWIKGNAGEPLTIEEDATYESLLTAYNNQIFSGYLQTNILSGVTAEQSIFVAALAYFLFENPGAHAKWEELERRASDARETLVADYEPGGVGDDFQRVVREHVARLKDRRAE